MTTKSETVDIVIDGGTYLTVNPQRHIITNGFMAINDSRIVAIGKAADLREQYVARKTFSGTDKLITPGLIDGHRHLVELARGLIPDNLATRDWLKDWAYPYLGYITEEQEFWHARNIMADMIKTGTTCVVDPGIKFPTSTFQAIEDAGIRAISGIWTWDQIGPDAEKCAPHFFRMSTDQALQLTEDTISQHNGRGGGRVRIWATLEGVGTCSDSLYQEALKIATNHHVGMLMHKASSLHEANLEQERFGHRPVEHMYRIGALAPNVYLNHMTACAVEEIPFLVETDAKVCQNPGAALKLAKGSTQMGKFVEMIEAGVTVNLGCDGSNSCDFSDMVRSMYLAATLPKDSRLDASVVTAEKVIEMATIDGARAIDWADEIGSLEVGKKADVVLWDMRRPEWTPTYNIVSVFVYSASGDSADTVIIDGKVVMERRNLLTLNEQECIDKVQAFREPILRQSGLEISHRWPVI